MGFKARKRTCSGCGSTEHDKRNCPGPKVIAKEVSVQPRAAPTSLEERIDSVIEEWKEEQVQAALGKYR